VVLAREHGERNEPRAAGRGGEAAALTAWTGSCVLNTTVAREQAAEALAVEIVDPFLAREGVIEHKA
jgi:hypothetical protein